MQTRQTVITVIAVLVVLGAFGINYALTNAKKAPERVSGEKSVKTVWSFKVHNDTVPTFVRVTGKLTAAEKIDLYAEVNGKLLQQRKAFKEGNRFAQGDVLLQIDSRDFGMNLKAQKSSFLSTLTQILPDIKLDYPANYPAWQKYLDEFDIEDGMGELPEPSSAKEKYFLAGRNIYGLYYNLKSLEETYKKYTIRAPFNGVVTQSQIDAGTNVRAGQPLGTFINTDSYELETSISVKDLKFVQVGDQVALSSSDFPSHWTGKVKRISDKIDPATQTVRIFVGVSGSDLKDGMYLNGDITSDMIAGAAVIPRKLLVGDTAIYVIEDTLLKLMPITVVRYDQGNAIITGLQNGDELLQDMLPGAYNGMPVKVATN